MDYSAAGSHIIMQGFVDPNGSELFGLQNQNPNPNPNWQQVDAFSIRPSQGLSLSLPNPTNTIGFHLSGNASSSSHQEQIFLEDGSGRFYQQQQQQPYQLKRSKYLHPAQELLSEFCNLGGSSNNGKNPKKKEFQWEGGGGGGPNSSPLYSMDLVELQKRKATLLSMLEEVYRRYRRYCEQMRAVVSTFEALAGEGSATVYSTLASKAMSRHFRCLRDGIMSQIAATKTAMGEKDSIVPGTTKGETPRLKKLELCLRQQKAFQQAAMIDSQPWRPQRGLPERSVSVLRAWLFEHFLHPYPSDVDKHILARQTGLSRSQVSNWFINARVRLWKPMVEEMYTEEQKEEENPNPNPNALSTNPSSSEDHKPGSEHLLNNVSGSLSSIINSHHPNPNPNPNPNLGVVNMDFASYNTDGGRVSLTLGLQQHSLLFSRDHVMDQDHGQQVQYSILDDDDEGQNLPYRNLMGTHNLLHDLP